MYRSIAQMVEHSLSKGTKVSKHREKTEALPTPGAQFRQKEVPGIAAKKNDPPEQTPNASYAMWAKPTWILSRCIFSAGDPATGRPYSKRSALSAGAGGVSSQIGFRREQQGWQENWQAQTRLPS